MDNIYLYFSNAFDKVLHDVCLAKLIKCELNNNRGE